MKITSVRIHLLAFDRGDYYAKARTKLEFSPKWEFPLIEVSTDAGITGWSMARGVHGEGRAMAHTLRDVYAHRLVGVDPVAEHESWWQKLKRDNRHLYSITDAVLGTLDVALWDLRGKAAGLPLASLLGRYRDRVPTYATLGRLQLETPEAVRESCAAARQAGAQAIKLQFWNGPGQDIPRLHAAREAMGPDFRLMLDAAGGHNLVDAIRIGHALSELGYYWFEEPVPDARIGHLRELRRRVRVPILAAETARLFELHNYLREEAVDIIRGDVYITAGITGLRKAMAMAELFGINLEIHGTGAPLLDVAQIHVACGARNCEYVEAFPTAYQFGIVGRALDPTPDGFLNCPSGPGLGIELDMDWVKARTVLTLDCPER